MVRPHVAIVTNVLPVHVGNFPDGEIGVANAKAEIFEGVEAPPATAFCSLSPSGEGSGVGGHNDLGAGGFTPPLTPPRQGEGDQPEQGERPVPCAVVLRDSPHFDLLRNAAGKHKARIITFGLHSDADVSLPNAPGEQANGSQYVIAVSRRTGKRIGFDLGMLGQHLAINSLAVVAAMEALGCDVGAATSALATVRSAAGRGARTALPAAGGNILLLDESYNANPASMAAALANLAATDNGGRRIAVMGDMLELAPPDQKHIAARYHKDLVTDLEPIDRVLCCGPLMRELYDLLPREKQAGWAEKSVELIDYVLAALRPGDVVMVKGSLGSRMAPIVDAIKKRFAGA
jgi:UDP-N-acetylmuramoyl-tripeptide--D-alanyl-D-alanine ligase